MNRLVRLHATLTLVWALLIVPSVIWWKDSVPWLVAMSCYANVAGHAAGWMGARSERATNQGAGS